MSVHVPPPLIALAAATAQRSLPGSRPSALRSCAAAGLAVASGALAASAAGRFRSRHTTVNPVDLSRSTALVTDGPNAWTRNPMYVGMAGLLLAHATARGSWLSLLPAAGFVGVIQRFQIRDEEAALRGLFGDDYDAYCARVPRWLGPVGAGADTVGSHGGQHRAQPGAPRPAPRRRGGEVAR